MTTRPSSSSPQVTGESWGRPFLRVVTSVARWRGRTKSSSSSRSTRSVVAKLRGMAASLPDASTGSAPGDRRDDADLGALGGGAAEAGEEAHVVVADVDVHEAPDLAAVVEHAGLDAVVVRLEVLEHPTERGSLRGDLGGAVGVVAQDGGDRDADAHGLLSPRWG